MPAASEEVATGAVQRALKVEVEAAAQGSSVVGFATNKSKGAVVVYWS